jgi:hypothetical protein
LKDNGGYMAAKNHLSITVSRINEGPRDEPYVTFEAHTVTVDSAGNLSITTESGGRSYTAGLWDGFEVKRIADPSTGRRYC